MAPMTSRRNFLALAAAVPAIAQQPTRDWTNHEPTRYPDPDVVAVEPAFSKYMLFNAVIYRHYTGTKWAEGPAWSAQGQYLVWSDIPNNRQLRLHRRGRARDHVPQSLRVQQRQHVRFRRPPACLRTRRTPRGALRARRQRHA